MPRALHDGLHQQVNLIVSSRKLIRGGQLMNENFKLKNSLPAATSELTHPLLHLKGFAKVRDLVPKSKECVQEVLDKCCVIVLE